MSGKAAWIFLMAGMLPGCYTAEGEKQRYIQAVKEKCEAQGKRFVLGNVQQEGIPNLTRFTTSVTGYCVEDCEKEGKQAFVLEEKPPGVPSKMICLFPHQLVHIPSPFGVDALASANVKGARILKVVPGSVAESAGIKYGDVIYEFAGKPIAASSELEAAVANAQMGQQILIKFRREEIDATVTARF